MATSPVNLPPGFILEEDQLSSTLPPGFVLEDTKDKPRTSLWEDVKIGYTDVANTLDTAGTLTWASLGKLHGMSDEAYDEYAKNLKRRRKMRQDAANPEGKEQGFSGKLTSLVGSLPGQIAALPFSPIETGMNALDAGESGTTTAKLVGLDTVSSALGLAIPGFGGTLLKRGAKGAAANTAQEYLTREAMSRTAETPKMREALAPNLENMALAAVLGGGTSAAFGKNKPKTNKPTVDTSNIDDIVKSSKAAENEVKIDMTDPGTRAAAYKYADDATVQRLEAALAKRNEPNPTITVDSQGRGFVGDEIDVKNQFDAQQALEDRQRQLEQDVARQAGLDFNAAERARQENAPTGFDAYQQSLRDSAETRQPGDNTPMNFESPYPVDASQYPSVLADAPYQYEGGLDFTLADANPTNLKFRRRPLDASPEVDPMAKANELLAGSELARKRPGQTINRGPGGGQRGAIDPDMLFRLIGWERLPNKEKINEAMLRGVIGQKDLAQAEKDILLKVYKDYESEGYVGRNEFRAGLNRELEKYKLGLSDTTEYADYGLDGLLYNSPHNEILYPATNIWTNDNLDSPYNHFGHRQYYGHTRVFYSPDYVKHVVEIQSDLLQGSKNLEYTPEQLQQIHDLAEDWSRNLDSIASDQSPLFLLSKSRIGASQEKLNMINGFAKDVAKAAKDAGILPEKYLTDVNSYDKLYEAYLRGTSTMLDGEKHRKYNQLSDLVKEMALEEFDRVSDAQALAKNAQQRRNISALDKDFSTTLIREELAASAKAGDQDKVRFATADTVARIEGWATDFSRETALRIERDKISGLIDDAMAARDFSRVENLTPKFEALTKEIEQAMSNPTFKPEHQGLYNRYKKEIERYLESIGARRVEDYVGNTWLEVDVKPDRAKRIAFGSQRGVLNIKDTLDAAVKALRMRYGAPQDTLETPISEANLVAKEKRVAKTRAAHEILGVKMPEWTDVTTQEEALHLASKTGDIASSEYTRGSASGLNYMTAYHKHPVLRYMRKLVSDAREQAVTFSKTYITAENGLSTYIKKMSDDQKLKLAELMTSLDKHQVDFTEQLGRQIGLDDNSIAFMNRHKEASDAMWSWSSKIHGDQGVKDAPKRKGYSPSVYGGDYFTLVTDTKGEIVAVISANTPGEFAKAISYYKTKDARYKFGTTNPSDARARFTGSNRKALQFADASVILSLLTDEAGGYNKLQSAMDLAAIKEAHTMYNFNMHNKRKKGLPGNLGNKPWLSAEENARDRLDATIRFYEEGAEYFAAQRPIEEANILVAHPSLADKPNLRKYMQEYVSNIEGRYVNQAGKLVNEAFGLTSNLVELATKKVPFVNDYVSPGNALKAANWTKNKMAQMYMGWFNFPFLAAQLMQPIQTGIPMMQLIGDRIGVDSTTLYGEMIKAGGEFSRFTGNKFLKSMGIDFRLKMDELTTEALEWGRLRGILDFTELERAYEGHKTKAGRVLDDVAEWSMQAGESMTRAPMFLAVVRVLDAKMAQEGVIDRTGVFEIAEKVTNQIMADYHHWERPTMYTGLGVVAPHAGGLTTFKHNYVGTQVLLAKEMAKGNASPMLLSMAQMAMFAGITGIPAYDEFDGIYQEIKDWFGDRSSISQDFLKNLPTWAKNGVISSMVDLNVQGKFSSADMKPDTLAKALFPHLSGAYEIGNASFEALSKGTEASVDNALVTATPSAWKQASKYALQRGPNGELYDKFGNTDVTRSEEDWKIAATTGMTPLDEAMDRNNLFQNRKNDQSRKDDMKNTAKKFKEAVIDDADPERIAEILNKYQELGGDAASLIQQIPTIKREQSMSSQERAQGTPTTPQGVRRYEEYNR